MERGASSPVPQLTMPGGDARRSTNNAQLPVVHADCLTFDLGEGIPASSVSSGAARTGECAKSPEVALRGARRPHAVRLPIRSGLSNRLSRY
jgi:hypothetical protein